MKRIHELSREEIQEWIRVRKEFGKKKYGDAHLQRYNLVDVLEEIFDAIDILRKAQDRIDFQELENEEDGFNYAILAYKKLMNDLDYCITDLIRLDSYITDKSCTDEKGGERIWWKG